MDHLSAVGGDHAVHDGVVAAVVVDLAGRNTVDLERTILAGGGVVVGRGEEGGVHGRARRSGQGENEDETGHVGRILSAPPSHKCELGAHSSPETWYDCTFSGGKLYHKNGLLSIEIGKNLLFLRKMHKG